MIDLHTHSTASDGSLSPRELILAAKSAGLSAIALTDHDTTAGIDEAIDSLASSGLRFVPGIEISAELQGGVLHLVGLYIDHRDPDLALAMKRLVEYRDERNATMAERLSALGMNVRIEELAEIAGGDVIGRPHFASLMVKKGYVQKVDDAFRNFLKRGRPAYVPKQKLEKRQAVELIRSASGVPVLAHPDQTGLNERDLDRLVRELVDAGLGGIEAYCTGYSASRSRSYADLAKRYGLVISGGSDFHGETKKGIALGRGSGDLSVPDDLLRPMAELASRIRETRRLAPLTTRD